MPEPDSSASRNWDCAAYGELPGKLRGTCFFAGVDHDPAVACPDLETCETQMAEERKRVYRRMQELSTADPLFADLADSFPTPSTLLGGKDSREDGS